MTPLHQLLHIAREDQRAGMTAATDIAFMVLLSLAFEAEARRWGAEHGTRIIGHGFHARPDLPEVHIIDLRGGVA